MTSYMGARISPRGFFLSVAAVAAAVMFASGCGGGSDSASADIGPPATFANGYLSFKHPPVWTPYPVKWSGELHFQPMLYLSTQPLRNPCRTKQNTTTCGWPVDLLGPDGVLIVMENRGFPGLSLDRVSGRRLHVGGRPAKRDVTRPGACGAIGGDVTVVVVVASPEPSNVTDVTACLRGPHLAANERRLEALLASTRFKS